MNRKFISWLCVIGSSALCAGCIPFPTIYGIVPVPVPMLIGSAIQTAVEQASKPSAWEVAMIEQNRNQLREDRELYRGKAQAGDTAGQLNLARVLFHQVFLYKTVPLFRDSADDLFKMTQEAEAERYLNLAVAQNFAPAVTYQQCRRRQYGEGGWPDVKDVKMLEEASEKEPHAKYLLAKYVYQPGSRSADPEVDRGWAAYLYYEAASAGDMDALVELKKLRRSDFHTDFFGIIDSYPKNMSGLDILSATERQRRSVCSDEYRN